MTTSLPRWRLGLASAGSSLILLSLMLIVIVQHGYRNGEDFYTRGELGVWITIGLITGLPGTILVSFGKSTARLTLLIVAILEMTYWFWASRAV